MSETPPADGAANGQEAPSLRVIAQYLKDLSFENPKAPESFRATDGAAPAIDVNVDVNARSIGQNQYEVELSVSARATRNNDVVFVVESAYAGLFLIENVPAEQLEAVMLVECPRLLFPFLRQIIADATRDGNFPPLMLEPIDFYGIYMQRKAQPQEQPAAADGGDSAQA
ncbi:MAG: protein-export chaperone SecB [Parvularculaceae bacterium]